MDTPGNLPNDFPAESFAILAFYCACDHRAPLDRTHIPDIPQTPTRDRQKQPISNPFFWWLRLKCALPPWRTSFYSSIQ